ncbi:hypothetical protein GCM10025777_19840 [Membranihabitans marinus]
MITVLKDGSGGDYSRNFNEYNTLVMTEKPYEIEIKGFIRITFYNDGKDFENI